MGNFPIFVKDVFIANAEMQNILYCISLCLLTSVDPDVDGSKSAVSFHEKSV